MHDALLAFSIGPVQDFIGAARTTRDLWTGSYLLSWLTARTIRTVREEPGAEILFPDVTDDALYAATDGARLGDRGALIASLPNTFVARVPGADAEHVADACRATVADEWRRIADAVHAGLGARWNEPHPGWDERWGDQIEHFWEVRVTVLPSEPVLDVPALQHLLGTGETNKFRLRMELLGRLGAAAKQVRRYPPHETDAAGAERRHEAGHRNAGVPDTRPKCALLGSWAQMGPLRPGREQMRASADFWNAVAGTSLSPARLSARDRLCAVSLVKRFAWPAYLADALGLQKSTLRYPDTHTLAALDWLETAGIDWRAHDERGQWSGYWLRWRTQHEGAAEGEPAPSDAVWQRIERARREHGWPPSYYAVLMVDGDRMGERLRQADEAGRRAISRMLARFAAKVREIVDEERGELVYAGGDDVLALLPARGAIACARRISDAFRAAWSEADPSATSPTATVSAGLVVAHAMEDLRAVLGAARAAERGAKDAGRDRLALSVRRRSGEESTVVCRWDEVAALQALQVEFAAGRSDRWCYTFRRQLEVLPEIAAAREAELRRLVGHAERAPDLELVLPVWEHTGAGQSVRKALDFVQRVQTASFLTRGS